MVGFSFTLLGEKFYCHQHHPTAPKSCTEYKHHINVCNIIEGENKVYEFASLAKLASHISVKRMETKVE